MEKVEEILGLENLLEESFIEYKERYKGFGNMIYDAIADRLPDVYKNLKFYRLRDLNEPDSFAIFFSEEHPFAIQLASLSEVIVLWNEDKHRERGTWVEDLMDEVINEIKVTFLTD